MSVADTNSKCYICKRGGYYSFIFILKQIKTQSCHGICGQCRDIVIIPVPPRQVQDEIVNALDSFVLLNEGIQEEISYREKQLDAYIMKLIEQSDYHEMKTRFWG